MNKILVTDSLFILPQHIQQLENAGFEVERLNKTAATEEELIAAVPGKVGYILGGIERVTQKVIDAADSLKVISFTGIGYKDFIPAWEYAESKGIKVTNAPDGPTDAVAEWSIAAALMMNRHFLELGRAGEKSFMTSAGLEGQRIGIIGLGRIGKRIAEMLPVFHPVHTKYYSTHHHPELEQELQIEYQGLTELLAESDVIFLCVPSDAGMGFIGAEQFRSMKDGTLLVSFTHEGVMDETSLLAELQAGRIRAISDNAMHNPDFNQLPLSHWYSFNGSNAFNTTAAIIKTSDIVVTSVLGVLTQD